MRKMFLFLQSRVKNVMGIIMNYFMCVRRMCATFRTRIYGVVSVAFDVCFFRRKLRQRISELSIQLSKSHEHNLAEHARCEGLLRESQLARAQLARLRVAQESVRDRTGFMVGAFIPDGVLTKLRAASEEDRAEFSNRVLKSLLSSALSGVFRINERGNLTALVFEPLGLASSKRLVTPIFESTKEGKPVFSAVVSPELELIERERRKMLTDAIGRDTV
jgi:hypothetical protein